MTEDRDIRSRAITLKHGWWCDVKLVLSVILVLTSGILIALILLHRGKGGGLSNLFGGGVSSSLGGSSVVEKNLDRFTIAVGLVWFASIISLGLLDKS